MPSHYWYTCDRCQDRSFRYRNVVRCSKCGGNLIRNGYTNLIAFCHAGIMLQALPPKEISEPVLELISRLDNEHISHMVAIISAWIAIGYDTEKFRDLMRRVEENKKVFEELEVKP